MSFLRKENHLREGEMKDNVIFNMRVQIRRIHRLNNLTARDYLMQKILLYFIELYVIIIVYFYARGYL